MGRFDFAVRVPAGATRDQFHTMLQNLLKERFHLALHYQRREMPAYELTVGTKGSRLKSSPAAAPNDWENPWWDPFHATLGKDGYPAFPAGKGGLATGMAGHNRWTAFHVSTADIARLLSDQLGRPVIDATGLKGAYDINLKWVVDYTWQLSDRAKAEIQEGVGSMPESPAGPSLIRAIQDQLGLKLNPVKAPGQVVVIDRVDKAPTAN
jgi:uncharacterized protein (TIGR03435 family)